MTWQWVNSRAVPRSVTAELGLARSEVGRRYLDTTRTRLPEPGCVARAVRLVSAFEIRSHAKMCGLSRKEVVVRFLSICGELIRGLEQDRLQGVEIGLGAPPRRTRVACGPLIPPSLDLPRLCGCR